MQRWLQDHQCVRHIRNERGLITNCNLNIRRNFTKLIKLVIWKESFFLCLETEFVPIKEALIAQFF